MKAVSSSGRKACNRLCNSSASNATSLVEIGDRAFLDAVLHGTLVMPPRVRTIGSEAFWNTELTGLDLSKATSLVEIGGRSFADTNLEGTLVIPPTVATIGHKAFQYTKLTYLDFLTNKIEMHNFRARYDPLPPT